MRNKRSENRQALPKFLGMLVVSAVAGGVLGFLAGFAGHAGLAETVKTGLNAFLQMLSPWAIPVCTVVLLGGGLGLYRAARRAFDSWDGEDEAAMEDAEEQLSWALLLSTLTLLVGFFFLAVSTAGVFHSGEMSPIYIVVEFLVSMGLVVFFQQKVVDLTRRMNPEKQGSVYDIKFHKKWFESCDEAEQRQIGRASYRAYRVTSGACPFVWMVLILGNMVFDFGLLPVFVTLVLWGILQVSYMLECIRLSHRKGGADAGVSK